MKFINIGKFISPPNSDKKEIDLNYNKINNFTSIYPFKILFKIFLFFYFFYQASLRFSKGKKILVELHGYTSQNSRNGHTVRTSKN